MYTKLSAGAALAVVAAFVASGPASARQTAAHQRNLPLVATSTLQHTLSVDTTGPYDTGTGSVTSSPAGIDCPSTCEAAFDNGTSVTLTATADPGSDFTGWSGGGCSGRGTCQVTLTADTTVDATFENPAKPTLSVATNRTGPHGSITSSPAGIDCGRSVRPTCEAAFDSGTSVTLTATADSSSDFTGWHLRGGGCSGTGTCQVTLTADTSVTALFAWKPPKVNGLKVGVNHAKHTVKVTFTGTDSRGEDLHFKCKLDKKSSKSCRSGIDRAGDEHFVVYKHLQSGKHTVQVQATDHEGYISKPAKLKFKV